MVVRAIGVLIVLAVLMRVLSLSSWLSSQPDDWQVLSGSVLGAVSLAIAGWAIWKLVHGKAIFNRIKTMFTFALLLLLTSCGYTVVEPGHVGIQINLSGSDKGVQDLPLKTGRIFYNPITETVLEWPTFVQTTTWTHEPDERGDTTDESITFSTKDKMAVNVDVSLSYSLVPERVPNFYVKFRSDDLDHFTHGFLRNVVRDHLNETAGKYPIDAIMGGNEAFITEVRDRIQKQLEPIGVTIEQFGFIGAPRPPESVIASINLTTQATQNAIKIENELRASQAEAAKTVAVAEGKAKAAIAEAQGEAEANRLRTASITPQILEWERLAVTKLAIGKWNGAPNLISGSGGSPTNFLFQIPQTQPVR